MRTRDAMIPAYPTWAHLWRLRSWRARWDTWFPFNAPGGTWTFSGRVALYHGLQRLELRPCSTILVPAYHHGVEIDTLLAAGYQVRYYRLTERLEIDLADVERQLDHTVTALYLIHYFGFGQPVAAARAWCDAHRVRLIEDCALSLFSKRDDTWLGSAGDLALFSVYKMVPLPHGGFLVTRGRRHAPTLRAAPVASTCAQSLDLLYGGLQASGWQGIERRIARASRLLKRVMPWDRARTISSGETRWDPRLLAYGAAGFSVWLMRYMDPYTIVARRRRNFARLAAMLGGHVPAPFRETPPGACPLFLPVMVPDKPRAQEALAQRGVQSVTLWNASHPTCPPDLAADVAVWRRHCLELPIHQELGDDEIDRVAEAALATLGRPSTHGPTRARDR